MGRRPARRVKLVINKDTALAPGDIRARGHGDRIVLRPEVKSRRDWMGLASALGTAVAKGADVVWEREITWASTSAGSFRVER